MGTHRCNAGQKSSSQICLFLTGWWLWLRSRGSSGWGEFGYSNFAHPLPCTFEYRIHSDELVTCKLQHTRWTLNYRKMYKSNIRCSTGRQITLTWFNMPKKASQASVWHLCSAKKPKNAQVYWCIHSWQQSSVHSLICSRTKSSGWANERIIHWIL